MPTYPARALVLRKTKLGEADTIVTMLSSEGGQIRAVAKGARKTRSRLGGRLEPFAVADLLLHTGRSLDIVTEARAVAAHDGIRSDLDKTVAASVVVDLLDKVTSDSEPEPVLFDLAAATMSALDEATSAVAPAMLAAFLLKVMAILGFRPSIVRCARCGLAHEGETAFSHDAGGALCDACSGIDPGAVRVGPATREALRGLLAATMAEVPGVAFSPAVMEESFRLLRAFVSYHVPARLRAMGYLSEQMAAGTWPSVDSAGGWR